MERVIPKLAEDLETIVSQHPIKNDERSISMQITIIAPGSRGDVQPYVALGKGLKTAGHTVRLLTTHDFQDLVTAHSLDFFDVGGDMETIARGMQTLLEQGNMLKILGKMSQAAQGMAGQAVVTGMTACQGSDLIIAGLGGLFVGLALSEKLGIPLVQAYLYPFSPTRAFPSVLMPLPQTHLPASINYLSHRLAQQMMWQTTRSADNRTRTKVLQLPPAPFWGPFTSPQHSTRPTLYGYSPQVIPTPVDWDKSIHVTGYWFLEPASDWEPPAALLEFLRSGPAPIYIGFGSIPNRRPEETANLVLQALALTGQRGILSSGWGGLKVDDLPGNVFLVGSIPHTWLFPQMAAVIHHGGAGTTAAGLQAGIPSILIPIFGDQPFWAQQVYELGVGPKPIPRNKLTVDRLTSSIQEVLSDQKMIAHASDLGKRIRTENGIAQAVTVLERFALSK